MNLEENIKNWKANKNLVDQLVKSLGELSRLDQDRKKNLVRIKSTVSKIEILLVELQKRKIEDPEVEAWLKEYDNQIKAAENELTKGFAVELEQQLKELGLSLKGHIPDLLASFFTLELDFDAGIAKIWYGPKKEYLSQCDLSTSEIAKKLEEMKKGLGSGLPANQFQKILSIAYQRVYERNEANAAPIISVLREMAFLLQPTRFNNNPKQENYKSYSRADFSFDIYHLRESFSEIEPDLRPHLSGATRSYTKKKSDYLWIPDDELTRGTTYSHIKIQGG